MLSAKFQKRALEKAFGPLTLEQTPDARYIASADGYIRKNKDIAGLTALGGTEEGATSRLFELAVLASSGRPNRNIGGRVTQGAKAYTNAGERVIYDGKTQQFVVK